MDCPFIRGIELYRGPKVNKHWDIFRPPQRAEIIVAEIDPPATGIHLVRHWFIGFRIKEITEDSKVFEGDHEIVKLEICLNSRMEVVKAGKKGFHIRLHQRKRDDVVFEMHLIQP
ncbi:hypothetical protein VTN31DRAFT_3416 [Thermomyces dupontii]|uniref:uncharacterized protein n=1 Tax=Talaromyces thermophilus TaxID=28565 RepID=UPI0037429D51